MPTNLVNRKNYKLRLSANNILTKRHSAHFVHSTLSIFSIIYVVKHKILYYYTVSASLILLTIGFSFISVVWCVNIARLIQQNCTSTHLPCKDWTNKFTIEISLRVLLWHWGFQINNSKSKPSYESDNKSKWFCEQKPWSWVEGM